MKGFLSDEYSYLFIDLMILSLGNMLEVGTE